MTPQERTSVLYRIIQGKYKHKIFGEECDIYSPTMDVLIGAQQIHDEIIEEYKYCNWIKETDCPKILMYNGLWNPDMDDKIDMLTKEVEECKFQIFKAFFNFKKREQERKYLAQILSQIDKLEDTKHSLDYLTLNSFASVIQSQFLICKIIYNSKNELLFPDFFSVNFSLLYLMQGIVSKYTLFSADIKDIARNEPWSSMWRAAKTDVFPKKGVQLTGEQRNLILYSKMYDNINEHPECPHEDIINDDDALDGWMIHNKRERDKSKSEKTANNLGMDGAQEIFIPVSSREDAQRVNSLNSVESNIVKKQREIAIKNSDGMIDSTKLPDAQLAMQEIAREKMKAGHG